MPGGVQSRFLDVLQGDRALALRQVVVWSIAALLLAGLAWILWEPLGPAVHAGGVLLGILVGYFGSRARTSRYEASIRDRWTQWMKYSLVCETVPEIHDRVAERSTRDRATWLAAGLLVLWVAEVLLLAAAIRADPDPMWAVPAIAVNGVLAGAFLGRAIQRLRWCRDLRESVTELVESGEIGVWGVL